MDPLSMTASIFAVLKLTTLFIRYVDDIGHATGEQQKLAMETRNLSSLLFTLRCRVRETEPSDPWFQQVKLLAQKEGPLDQLEAVLKALIKQVSGQRTRDQIKSALKWTFTKSEVDNTLERMERLKSLIQFVLIADLSTLTRDIHEKIEAIGKQVEQVHVETRAVGKQVEQVHVQMGAIGMQVEQIHVHTERLPAYIDEELQHRLARWLGIPDPSTNYNAALRKRHSQTGLWLVDGDQFDGWRKSESSLMWLHGNAGCGKTLLSAAALQRIISDQDSDPDTAIGYFYFDFNDVDKQSSEKAIRSLLFQFTQHTTQGFQGLEHMYRSCGEGQRQPAEDAVLSLFEDTINRIRSKYIILDALDECTHREDFLEFLHNLVAANPAGLRVMATSRREKDIEDELRPIANHNINIQSTVVDTDIKIYVRHRLATDSKLKKWPEPVQKEITCVMMSKANGMFRWVYCQLESIRDCGRLRNLRKALSSLPETLDETYDRTLQGLKSKNQFDDTVKALQWLCHSMCPLTLTELAEVVSIETGEDAGFDPENRPPDPKHILAVCSSLITYVDDGGIHDDSVDWTTNKQRKSNQIRLAHFSVKEYLLSDRCNLRLHFKMQACHIEIAEGCLRYLVYISEQSPLAWIATKQYPLAPYAMKYWWLHARQINEAADHRVFDLAERILNVDNMRFIHIMCKSNGIITSLEGPLNPLFFAARFGLIVVVKRLLSRIGDDIAQRHDMGIALVEASSHAYEDVVQSLLDAGADMNVRGYYGTALQQASRRDHEKVVQLLLDAGAKPDAVALKRASRWNSEEVVKLLLDAGAKPDAITLQEASERGHKKVIQLLLDAGVKPDAIALQQASRYGREDMVKRLLDAGAKPDAIALQKASKQGSEKVIKLLLDAGVKPDAIALQQASRWSSEEVVKLLLDAGAKPDAVALQEASRYGREKVVKLLLDAGAKPDAIILQEASTNWNSEKTVKLLLDAGAKPDAVALQEASRCGREEVVKLFLDTGVKPDAITLQKVSRYGREEVVKLLLDAGVKPDAIALQEASKHWKSEKTVKLLLDAGAKPDVVTLQEASKFRKSEKTVKLLLDAGAKPDAIALQVASRGNSEKVVKLLLDAGAGGNDRRAYDTALGLALERGRRGIVRVLLTARVEDGEGGRSKSEDRNRRPAILSRRRQSMS